LSKFSVAEEYEKSRNTKYFRAIDLGEQNDYLVTLDPIDGTQFYLDGHNNYQIILSILNADDFEGVIALSPAQNYYYYALRNEGAYQGRLDVDLETCTSLKITNSQPIILLGWGMSILKTPLSEKYQVIDVKNDYSSEKQISNLNGILSGEITGAVLKSGNFIDGAALAFLAKEAGCLVSTLDGFPLPPLSTYKEYSLPGLIIASSTAVHQDLLKATQSLMSR
jgi:fructose-1,6-bisphosphatase/inositol monophosphatase family enzyme